MKTSTKNLSTILRAEREHPVRLIKAAQAGKLLGGAHAQTAAAKGAHAKPEIRLVKAGPDYCDLEIVCGCGESTQVRCWNAPANQTANAVAA